MLLPGGSLPGLWCSLALCSGVLLAQELPPPAQAWQSATIAWQRVEQPVVIGVALLPALVALDRPLAAEWGTSRTADVVFGVARLYGERWTPAVLAAGLYGAGWLFGEERLRRAAIALVGGAGVTALLVTGFKVVVGRARPSVGTGSFTFRAPGWEDAYQSFPSGHSALAFLMSTVLVLSMEAPPAVQGLAYGAAAMTAMSRLYHRRHWLSDVVAGALIGWAVGHGAVAVMFPARPSPRLELVPTAGGMEVRVPLR